MATYDRIDPATIANLAAVIDDPLDTEAANKLAQVDLQTRRFIYDFLITKFDDSTGKLKADAIDTATTLLGLVNGSTSNTGTQRQVVQGTVSTPDIRDLARSTAKVGDKAVPTAKINDAAVGTTQIADDAVTTAKIAASQVTAAKLATDAVETAKIKDSNVTTAKILDANVTQAKLAANAVDGGQLVLGSAEGQLLVSGVSPYTFAVKSLSGDATLSKDGVLSLSTKGIVEVEEQASLNTAAGGSMAATWNSRGVTRAGVKTFDTLLSTFLTISSEKLALAAGDYIIEASSPAYAVGTHQLRLERFNGSNVS